MYQYCYVGYNATYSLYNTAVQLILVFGVSLLCSRFHRPLETVSEYTSTHASDASTSMNAITRCRCNCKRRRAGECRLSWFIRKNRHLY